MFHPTIIPQETPEPAILLRTPSQFNEQERPFWEEPPSQDADPTLCEQAVPCVVRRSPCDMIPVPIWDQEPPSSVKSSIPDSDRGMYD